MANKKVSQLTSKPSVLVTDLFPIADPSTGQLYKTTISDLGTAIGSGVSSVNGLVGAVVLDTDDIQELVSPTNKWFTDTRARAALSASSPLAYNSGTGVFSIPAATSSQNGYLTSTDWTTFNSKVSGTGITGYYARWTSAGVLSDGFINTDSNITYVAGMGLTTLSGLDIQGSFGGGTDGLKLKSYDETTGKAYINFINDGGVFRLGIEGSTGGGILPGSTAYATVLTSGLTAKNLEFGTNNALRLTLDGTTGAATFTSSVTASALYVNGMTAGSGAIYHSGSRLTMANYNASGTLHFEVNGGTGALTLNADKSATFVSTVSASSFIKSGGTSNQYLMADGSVSTLTNPVTGTGSTNYVPKFTSASTISNSNIQDSGSLITLGYNTAIAGSNSKMIIGSTSVSTNTTLQLQANISGGTTSNGIVLNQLIQSDVVTRANLINTVGRTAASAFNLTTLVYFNASQGAFGAGSTVTNQYGFSVESNLIGATNNYGFYGNIGSGTNRWNIYMSGTANNHLAGNLLIGSTADNGSKLQVTGSATFSSTVQTPYVNIQAGANAEVANINSTNANGGYLTWQTSGSVIADIGTLQQIFGTGGATNFGINARGAKDLGFGTNNTERLRITSAGNVGIGTTAPDSKLYITGGSTRGMRVDVDSGVQAISISPNGVFGIDEPGVGNGRFSINTNGRVGIGTGSPSYKLHVSGDIYANQFRINDTGGGFVTLEMENSSRWRINYLGRFSGYGAGALTTDASGNITAASDRTLKDIIRPVENVLENIMDFEPVYFKWNDKTDLDKENVYMSTIAQSIQKHYPDAVGKMADGTLTVQDRAVTAILVQAIKELKAELDTLKNK